MSSSGVFAVMATVLALLLFIHMLRRSPLNVVAAPASFALLVVLVIAEVVARDAVTQLVPMLGICLVLGALVRLILVSEREDEEAEVTARWSAFEHAFRRHVAAMHPEDETPA